MVACINDINVSMNINVQVCWVPELFPTTPEASTCDNGDPCNIKFNPTMIACINDVNLAISSNTDAFRPVQQDVVHTFTEWIKNAVNEIAVLNAIIACVCYIKAITSLEA
jgi:hypothetical protein